MPFSNPHPLYKVWNSMCQRINNPRFKQWKDYGGRGLTICPQWRARGDGFRQFVSDMGPRPAGHTLERINNNGNYEPSNCRWATRKEQQHNQTVTRKVVIEGVEYAAVELAQRAGLKTDSVVARAKLGLTLAEVLDPKKRVYREGLAIGWKFGRGAGKS